MPEHFWPKTAPRQAAQEEVRERIGEFKRWLSARPETCFALVGHSAFFQEMTGMDRKLSNCEAGWFLLDADGSISAAPELPQPPEADP